MPLKFSLLLSFLLLSIFYVPVFGQTPVKVLSYNVLNYPNENNAALDGNMTRAAFFREIVENANADIIIIQELLEAYGATDLLNELNTNGTLGKTYGMSGGFDPFAGCMLFYNADLFNFISVTQVPNVNTATTSGGNTVYAVRNNAHYALSYPVNPSCAEQELSLHVFATHLKAGEFAATPTQIASDERRNLQILDLMDYLTANNFTATDNIIFGGDCNFYGDYEPAYQTLINHLTFPFSDPYGIWVRNDPIYKDIFSQSTRATGIEYNNGGIWGGMDDRFDFWFINEAIANNADRVSLIPNTYGSYGNTDVPWNGGATDGTHPLKMTLELMSDHYPMMMQLEMNSPISLCPNVCVTSETYSGDIPSGLYSTINTINVSGTIAAGAIVNFEAGDCISLEAEFEVAEGAELSIENIPCISN